MWNQSYSLWVLSNLERLRERRAGEMKMKSIQKGREDEGWCSSIWSKVSFTLNLSRKGKKLPIPQFHVKTPLTEATPRLQRESTAVENGWIFCIEDRRRDTLCPKSFDFVLYFILKCWGSATSNVACHSPRPKKSWVESNFYGHFYPPEIPGSRILRYQKKASRKMHSRIFPFIKKKTFTCLCYLCLFIYFETGLCSVAQAGVEGCDHGSLEPQTLGVKPSSCSVSWELGLQARATFSYFDFYFRFRMYMYRFFTWVYHMWCWGLGYNWFHHPGSEQSIQ